MRNTNLSYGNATRLIHIINAILLIIVWSTSGLDVGLVFFIFHIFAGIAALVLTTLQLVWHFADTTPDPLSNLSELCKLAIHWNHWLILFTALGAGITGIVLWQIDRLDGFHQLSSHVLVALFLMHVAGVFFFQFTKGDALTRMGFNPFRKTWPF